MAYTTSQILHVAKAIQVVEKGETQEGSPSLEAALATLLVHRLTVKRIHRNVAMAAYRAGMLVEYDASPTDGHYKALGHGNNGAICNSCRGQTWDAYYGFGPGTNGQEFDFCPKCVGVTPTDASSGRQGDMQIRVLPAQTAACPAACPAGCCDATPKPAGEVASDGPIGDAIETGDAKAM